MKNRKDVSNIKLDLGSSKNNKDFKKMLAILKDDPLITKNQTAMEAIWLMENYDFNLYCTFFSIKIVNSLY